MSRATTVPSTDRAFARAVHVVLDQLDHPSPHELEDHLRALYPRVAVSERLLSGDTGLYYVYRDGLFVRDPDDAWWNEPGTARARVDADSGVFVEITDTWAELMGGRPDRFIGRHYTELVLPEARPAAETFFDTLKDLGEIHSHGLVRRGDGTRMTIEFRAVLVPEGIDVFYRPIDRDPNGAR